MFLFYFNSIEQFLFSYGIFVSALISIYLSQITSAAIAKNGYITRVKSIDFEVSKGNIKISIPWWSRKDFGLWKKTGFLKTQMEATDTIPA